MAAIEVEEVFGSADEIHPWGENGDAKQVDNVEILQKDTEGNS